MSETNSVERKVKPLPEELREAVEASCCNVAMCSVSLLTEAAAEIENLRQVLGELVALKELKYGPMERSIRASMSIGANPSAQYHLWNEDYKRRKPLAWNAARDALGLNVI